MRFLAGLLQGVSALNLLELAVRFGFDLLAPGEVERAPLPLVARRFFFLTLVPLAGVGVMRLFSRARVTVDAGKLVIDAEGGALEAPVASIATVRPWRIPWPEPGVELLLRSGRVLGFALASRDPAALVRALGQPDDSPRLRDAAAKARVRLLHHPALKLVLVPAVVTFIVFRLHQLITFGGLTGEWQQRGLRAWLHTLTGVSFSIFGGLWAFAAAVRAALELLALPASRRPWGRRFRIALEVAGAVVFYGAIVAVLALRLG